MSTTSTTPATASLTIPADYVQDFWAGLVREVVNAADSLRIDQDELILKPDYGTEDRTAAVEWLGQLTQIAKQMPSTSVLEDATLKRVPRSTLLLVLEEVSRVVSKHIETEVDYAPVPLERVAELTTRLAWVTSQAARIEKEA